MSIQDVLKKSFLNQLNSDLSTQTILTVLLITAIIGVYIFFVYRITCRKAFYNKSFAISLVVISMVTSIIILAVQSSIVISLGMVGALSIVRFRTAIKEPMDLGFLFWSISVGIICGANLYEAAIEGSLAITIVMLALHYIPNVKPTLLLLVNADDMETEDEILKNVKKYTKNYEVVSRNITPAGMDILVELKTKTEREQRELLNSLTALEKVGKVTLMQHNGDVVV